MYEIFEKLCTSRGVTPYRVSKETEIATSTFSDWKKGKSTPKADKMQIIADYFNVSLEYLMTGKESALGKFAEQGNLLVRIRNDERLFKALEKYFSLTDEQKNHILDLIEILSEM